MHFILWLTAIHISILMKLFFNSFFTRFLNKKPSADPIAPISKFFTYSHKPLLRPFTCHLNPIYLRAVSLIHILMSSSR